MDLELSRLAYRRQFLITPDGWRPSSDWPVWDLGDEGRLARHPDLTMAQAGVEEQKRFVLLGLCVDTGSPHMSATEILRQLCQHAGCMDDVEQATYTWSGRWVLWARLAGHSRVYHDACALKPVYHCRNANGSLCLASQPALLEAAGLTHRCDDMVRQFEGCPHDGGWPIGLVPYTGVTQLWANHFLCLVSGRAQRYWPGSVPPVLDPGEAARSIARLLRGGIEGALERGARFMGLTGGYDSRAIFASARGLASQLQLYTLKLGASPPSDQEIPRKIAALERLPLHAPAQIVLEAPLRERLLANVGGLFYDPVVEIVQTFHEMVGEGPIIEGVGGELLRAPYHRKLSGRLPDTPEQLAAVARFPDNPLAMECLEAWRSSLPADCWVDPCDLIYWESRMGVFGSTGWSLKEGLYESFTPYNNRALLEIGLCQPDSERISPYPLVRRIIGLHAPHWLKFPFNGETHSRWPKLWARLRGKLKRLLHQDQS